MLDGWSGIAIGIIICIATYLNCRIWEEPPKWEVHKYVFTTFKGLNNVSQVADSQVFFESIVGICFLH
jgi:hypothetical protein